MASNSYRIIEHTADIGFEVWGTTLEQLFEAAASAFFDIMWQIDICLENEPQTLEVTGIDHEVLLVNFLEEFLYLYDAKNIVCTGIEVRMVTEEKISARARLQKFDDMKDQELLNVKAVTYHQLYIGRNDDFWTGRIFLDI